LGAEESGDPWQSDGTASGDVPTPPWDSAPSGSDPQHSHLQEDESEVPPLRLADESEETTLDAALEPDGMDSPPAPLRLATPEQEAELEPGDSGTSEDCFQVFWSHGEDFEESRSTVQPYVAASTSVLEIRVDADAPITRMRLDPNQCEGKLCLRRIEIWDNVTFRPVFASSEENAFENLSPMGDLEVEGIERDTLLMASCGNDPQLVLDLPDGQSTSVTVSVEFEFMRVS
jgi:hypothetical protein